MKKLIVVLIIILLTGCTPPSYLWNKNNTVEVDNLTAKTGIDKVTLNWELNTDKDIEKIEILRKYKNKDFELIETVDKDTNSIDIEEKLHIEMTLKLRTVDSRGKKSEGKDIKTRIKHMINKNMIPDNVEGRQLMIYLPESYRNETEKRYPVVYMLDGQNMFFDSTTYNRDSEWRVDETLNQLIRNGKVDEMIVVGIYCSPKKSSKGYTERYREYSPYKEASIGVDVPRGKEFGKFIVNKVIPYIDSEYRTISNRDNRAIMGCSMGGLYSLWLGYNYSEVFSMVAAFSPSLWVAKGAIIQDITKEKKDLKIWIDKGTSEWNELPRRLVNALQGKGYEYGKDLVYYEVHGGGHSSGSWSQRVAYPFVMFKGKPANKIITMNVDIENVFTRYGERYLIVNPTIELDNGMKYSAYDLAKYELLNNEDGQINKYGLFEFSTDKDLKVKVTCKELKQVITISYDKVNFQ